MHRRRLTVKRRSRVIAMAWRQRSAIFAADWGPMRAGIRGSGIHRCLRGCRRITGAVSARGIRRCFTAGPGLDTERCSGMTRGSSSDDPFLAAAWSGVDAVSGWSFLLGRRGDFEVDVGLGADADRFVVDEERLVAKSFDCGEGCGLEQRWAADDLDALHGA